MKEYTQSIPDDLFLRAFILILVFISGGIAIYLHWYWLKSVAHADKTDKDLAFEARDKAIKYAQLELLNIPCPKYKTSKDNKSEDDNSFSEDWSFKFQFHVTIMLISIVMIIIFYVFLLMSTSI